MAAIYSRLFTSRYLAGADYTRIYSCISCMQDYTGEH